MMLKEIVRDCGISDKKIRTAGETDISGIAYDSRAVKKGWLFIAVRGEKFDGHNFIPDALSKGAVAIVSEKKEHELKAMLQDADTEFDLLSEPAVLQVEDSRRALACIANNFCERPSGKLSLTGITGTNGKTTTTYILKSILEKQKRKVGLIGTIQYMIGNRILPALHTTPESPEFQQLLRDMLQEGCTHVLSEVSSHALAQHRVDGALFQTAVFTNLTRDHLDFHKTMENYFQAKRRLFADLLSSDGTAVINIDDVFGKELYSELLPVRRVSSTLKIHTFGFQAGADITAHDIRLSYGGMKFVLSVSNNKTEINTPLTGMFNVYNIMAAAGAAVSQDVPLDLIAEGINDIRTIPGRFERIEFDGQDFLCIIDYAHTEDALERLIITAKELLEATRDPRDSAAKKGNGIITVFGCGGDRDRGKRPAMGAAATGLSNFAIITSDNPRSEDPLQIISEIEKGAVNKNYLIEPDRRKAIQKAVQMAETGDIVLIAGKGHEDYQESGGVRQHFSDKEIAEEAVRKRIQE